MRFRLNTRGNPRSSKLNGSGRVARDLVQRLQAQIRCPPRRCAGCGRRCADRRRRPHKGHFSVANWVEKGPGTPSCGVALRSQATRDSWHRCRSAAVWSRDIERSRTPDSRHTGSGGIGINVAQDVHGEHEHRPGVVRDAHRCGPQRRHEHRRVDGPPHLNNAVSLSGCGGPECVAVSSGGRAVLGVAAAGSDRKSASTCDYQLRKPGHTRDRAVTNLRHDRSCRALAQRLCVAGSVALSMPMSCVEVRPTSW